MTFVEWVNRCRDSTSNVDVPHCFIQISTRNFTMRRDDVQTQVNCGRYFTFAQKHWQKLQFLFVDKRVFSIVGLLDLLVGFK